VQQRSPAGVVEWLTVLGDVRGSVAVTVPRGSSVVTSNWWAPYGARRGSRVDTVGTRGYLGQAEDVGSGLTYLNNRYYDPQLGVFLSVDPLVATTGDPYLYAAGNPTTLSDPSGLMALPGGEWLCEGGGVMGCSNPSVKDYMFNSSKNLWDDINGRARTPGVIGTGCSLGTDSRGVCVSSSLRPISTLTDVVFDPDSCSSFWSWSCAFEVAGIIPWGKAAKAGRFLKWGDEAADSADLVHDIDKATNTAGGWLDDAATAKVPSEWGPGAATKKGVGTRWTDPANPGNGVRIDQGNPLNTQVTQQVDHVVVRYNGQVIGRNGQPISGSIAQNAEQAHIPLSEWQTWNSWFAP
jgi:RHS repeat-associated protein